MKINLQMLLVAAGLIAGINTTAAQGTAFTYQGRLNAGAKPANGSYDLAFSLYSVSNNGTAFAGPILNSAIALSNGLFTATLDFGAGVFTGANYWLEIGVRTNGNGGFTTLAPRQLVTPAPYSIYASSAGSAGSVAAANIVGTVPLAQLPAAVVTNNQAVAAFSNLTLNANLNLPATTTNTGIIYSGGSTLIYSYGTANIFAGAAAGNLTMTGNNNAGMGVNALHNNMSGSQNTANGVQALSSNTAGSDNTASGYQALFGNTSGYDNTASGYQALYRNTTGYFNAAHGEESLFQNTAGFQNTANGFQALYYNTNGYDNTASGVQSLFNNTSGKYNVGLGYQAGYNLTTGNNNIDIGNAGMAGESGIIRIGTPGVHTQTSLAGAVAVNGATIIDASGNWVGNPTGLIGPQGTAGATGATGATGPQGPAGVTGASGATGSQGATGATGATGPQGPPGPSSFVRTKITLSATGSTTLPSGYSLVSVQGTGGGIIYLPKANTFAAGAFLIVVLETPNFGASSPTLVRPQSGDTIPQLPPLTDDSLSYNISAPVQRYYSDGSSKWYHW